MIGCFHSRIGIQELFDFLLVNRRLDEIAIEAHKQRREDLRL
jgi:hypothetical protein